MGDNDNNATPDVTIQLKVNNSRVRKKITSGGNIKIQTDGKANFIVGDRITNTKAGGVIHEANIEQTLAEPTTSHSSAKKAKVMIGNLLSKCVVKEDVVNKSKITFQRDGNNEFVIADEHDKIAAENVTFKPEIKHTSRCKDDEVDGSNSASNCVVCLTKAVKIMLDPCNHAQFCVECIDRIEGEAEDTAPKCPTCRNAFTGRRQIFLPWNANVVATSTSAAVTTETRLQADVSSPITDARDETEWPTIGIHHDNPLPGQNVIYRGEGSVVVARKARKVANKLNFLGNIEDIAKLARTKSHPAAINTVTVTNIGPMNQIKDCEEMKNEINVTINSTINEIH